MKHFEIDIDSERVRELVQQHGPVFIEAMNAMVMACQVPDATQEENMALLLRSAISYASGICNTLNVSPKRFAEGMEMFSDVKINFGDHKHIRIIK